MSQTKAVVALTNCNMEKMSRFDLLNWINTNAQTSHVKVEELCSGVAYCKLLEQMFPQCIGMKKIKVNAKLEHEYLHNLKLLQSGLMRMKFDNPVPIDRLIKGRFQDNFEYLQWFKKFYDTHGHNGKENNSAGMMAQRPPLVTVTAAAGAATKPSTKSAKKTPTNNNYLKTTPDSSYRSSDESSVSPDASSILQKTLQQLSEQRETLDEERKGYYKKLMDIEDVLKKSVGDGVHVEWAQRALSILYNHNANGSTEALHEIN